MLVSQSELFVSHIQSVAKQRRHFLLQKRKGFRSAEIRKTDICLNPLQCLYFVIPETRLLTDRRRQNRPSNSWVLKHPGVYTMWHHSETLRPIRWCFIDIFKYVHWFKMHFSHQEINFSSLTFGRVQFVTLLVPAPSEQAGGAAAAFRHRRKTKQVVQVCSDLLFCKKSLDK